METKNTLSILFLLVLGFSACNSMPAGALSSHEDAPTLQEDNAGDNARRSQHMVVRSKREGAGGAAGASSSSGASLSPDVALANATGPKLIKDLFINMTNSSNFNSQANIIRSLEYSPKVPKCGEFNFTLTALDPTEFILKAELHLWLNVHSPPQHPVYVVGIKAVRPDGTETKQNMRLMEVGDSPDHYVTFMVTDLLKDLVNEGLPSAILKVNIYKDIADYQKEENAYGCGQELKFAYEEFTEATMPTLIAYIYDQRVDQIDYQKIAKNLDLDVSSPTSLPGVDGANGASNRRKRSGQLCGVQPLMVQTTSDVFKNIVEQAAGTTDFEIIFPIEYDVGTCGGVCDSHVPTASPSNHAPMLDLLLKDGTLNPADFTTCCVPVKYTSLRIFVDSPSIAIVTIDNIIVDTCECLDILI